MELFKLKQPELCKVIFSNFTHIKYYISHQHESSWGRDPPPKGGSGERLPTFYYPAPPLGVGLGVLGALAAFPFGVAPNTPPEVGNSPRSPFNLLST